MSTKRLLLISLIPLMLMIAAIIPCAHAQEEELVGDMDGDADVDKFDLGTFAMAYGSKKDSPNYNPQADLDLDGDIDKFDLGTFAMNYGKSRQGTGILYVYTDEGEREEVAKNAAGNYLVYPGVTYHFKIVNITEYEKTNITVWARYKIDNTPYNVEIGSFHVGKKPHVITFKWTIPDLPITTSMKFKYGTDYQGPKGTWYYAAKGTYPSPPRLLLVIPEVFLGPISAIAALFLGFRARAFIRKRAKSH